MARITTAQADVGLDAIIVPATVYYLALNTGDPGTTGASEVTGGSYARQPITFVAASAGSKASGGTDATQTITGMPVEAGCCPYFSIWTTLTAGTFLEGGTTTGLSGAISAGATITFASGAVTFTLS